MDTTVWLWLGFILLIVFFLALDLGVFNRKAHVPGIKESLGWTIFWVCMALLFNVAIYFMYAHDFLHIRTDHGRFTHETLSTEVPLDTEAGPAEPEDFKGKYIPKAGFQAAKMFFTGYVIEKSLSLDNIFVIGVIFSFFAVPRIYQHRVLFWGIFGALVMRAAMILLGVTLIHMFEPILYFFGAILIFTAIKMFRHGHENEEIHPENNALVKFAQKHFRVTNEYHGEKFFVRIDGLLYVTPMFIVLLVIESNDLVFAVDSIPAIFAITQDPFLVFTSNVFAILGLRSLYFVMAAMIAKFRYLQTSLAVILAYVGVKLLCFKLIEEHGLKDIMTWVSLAVIFIAMILGVVASIAVNRKEHDETIRRLRALMDATKRFRKSVGRFPTNEEGLAALVVCPESCRDSGWEGPYISHDIVPLESDLPIDPWKNPFQYAIPGTHSEYDYEIWSIGPDLKEGTDDDIYSWMIKK